MRAVGKAIVLDYATERVIRSPRWYYALLSLPGAALMAAGAWMGVTGAPDYWLICFCLGLLLLGIPAVMLMTGGWCLRLGEAGFSVRQGFGSEKFRWDDIVEFTLVEVRRGGGSGIGGSRISKEVGVTCRTDPKNRDLSRQRRRAIARHSTLKPQYLIDPEPFGMTADALMSLLEEARQKAINPPRE